ncbi:hypothetical protein ACQ4PT_059448 [Festuca glaucescens]
MESAPALARLPSAAISFDWPCNRHQTGWMDFMALNNNIVAVDHEGRTLLYDCASRAIRAMPQKSLAARPGRPRGFSDPEEWHWRPSKYEYEPEEAANPYAVSSYTVVGDSQIWISTLAGGTFSYDTASGIWSKAPVAVLLPFRGRAEYVPELGLWFGFSPEDEQLCAADLSLTQPLAHKLWEDSPPPESCFLRASHLLPLGSGKLCVARVFEKTERGKLLPSGYTKAERFAVLSGVEVFRAAGVEGYR